VAVQFAESLLNFSSEVSSPMSEPTQRRQLRFESIADCRAEVQRLLAADARGQLTRTGNWTPGQIFSHVAAWINYGYEGYPMKPLPSFVQWLLRLSLRKIYRDGMRPGVRIPGIKQGTTGMDDMPVAEAGERLLKALERLEQNPDAPHISPAFGKMSHADRITLNLRHAELHLSFLHAT
jgi:hypothetical protein